MTIKVTVTNADTRPTAVISVTPQDAVTGQPHSPPKDLNSGESHDIYVSSGTHVVVREVSQ